MIELTAEEMFVKDAMRKLELKFKNKDDISTQFIYQLNDVYIAVFIIKNKIAIRVAKSIESLISNKLKVPTFFQSKYFKKNLKVALSVIETRENFTI